MSPATAAGAAAATPCGESSSLLSSEWNSTDCTASQFSYTSSSPPPSSAGHERGAPCGRAGGEGAPPSTSIASLATTAARNAPTPPLPRPGERSSSPYGGGGAGRVPRTTESRGRSCALRDGVTPPAATWPRGAAVRWSMRCAATPLARAFSRHSLARMSSPSIQEWKDWRSAARTVSCTGGQMMTNAYFISLSLFWPAGPESTGLTVVTSASGSTTVAFLLSLLAYESVPRASSTWK
mmetsp:Transcript_16575/g.41785  ORF Transcript_16575/g.41785 Transcript_16575/m.41785 type:complete len:238 (-) Transcript_16575:528-1241(-)